MPNPEALPTWAAGHRITGDETAQILALLTASGPDGGLWAEQFFYRNANQTFASSSTLTNDNAFTFPVVANAIYTIEGYFVYTTNSTALFKGAWSLPAGATGTWDPAAPPSTITTGQSSAVLMQAFGLTTTLVYGFGSSTTAFHASGSLQVGGTPGTAVWTFAQSVITAVQTGMVAGSWLSVKRRV